jgi:hypothetical protein
MNVKRKIILALFLLASICGAEDGPEFTPAGLLKRPQNYREWIYLSSGLGMTYGPMAAEMQTENPPFDNVFVNREAYHAFLASGHWPDKTIFVLEVRASQSKSSINQGGHFQSNQVAMEIHVKDEKRFPGKWAFFDFPNGLKEAKQIPLSESCYSCHEKHGEVDTTFVQFYPTLHHPK